MSTHSSPLPRRLRFGIALASLIAVAGVLAGCSAGAEYAEAGEAPRAEEFAPAGGDTLYAQDGGSDPAAPTADRSVIVTGEMYMTVDNPIDAADNVARIVQSVGGRVDGRAETAPDEGYGGSAYLTLRIPSDKLDTVLNQLRTLGTVDELRTDSVDVTNEVTDLEARISTLRASTERIEGLLAEAKDISDIITLENELANRQAELESLEARQRGLDDQVSLSTIQLSLTTEPVVIVHDEGPKTFLDGLASGWDALTAFVSWVLVVLGVLLPWLILLALITLAVVWAVRASKSRTARRNAQPVEPTSVEVPPTKAATTKK